MKIVMVKLPVHLGLLLTPIFVPQTVKAQQDSSITTTRIRQKRVLWREYADEILSAKVDDFKKANARESLSSLPLKQREAGLLYILHASREEQWQFSAAEELLAVDPSESIADSVFPYFAKWPLATKTQMANELLSDLCLVCPDNKVFKKMVRFSLNQNLSRSADRVTTDNVNVMSLALSSRADTHDKILLHKALLSYPYAIGVWNALTLLQDVSASERTTAQKIFSTTKDEKLKLAVAAALLPYQASMKDYVLRIVNEQIRNAPTGSSPLANIPLKSGLNCIPQNREPVLDSLPILRYISKDVALPVVVSAFHSPSVWGASIAELILATRFPAELLKQIKNAATQSRLVNYPADMALIALLYPSYKPQVQIRFGNREVGLAIKELREAGLANSFQIPRKFLVCI